MKILYITRKYPPSTGGMETAAYELYAALAAEHDVSLVKWGGKNKYLPVVYPMLFVQALIKGLSRRPDVIYLQDGIMGTLGWVLKGLLRRPTVITVHGLEATYKNPIYQKVITPFITKQNRLVVGSRATEATVKAALPTSNPTIITYGVRDVFYNPEPREQQLQIVARETGVPLERLRASKLLHTNGRLVRRKGVLWFVGNVMKQLSDQQAVLYFVSGKGKDKELIEHAIAENGLQDHVFLLGRVSDELLRALYNVADIFVMPNVPVPNDMEGFGLVALEAASCGTMVVGSDLEGIQDAVTNGQNGILVAPGDAAAYVTTLQRELATPSLSREAIRSYTMSHYSWAQSARQYAALMQQLISG